MGLLRGDERDQLIKLLLKLPNISNAAMRRVLVAGCPAGLLQVIEFSDIAIAELNSIVDLADGDAFAQLADSSWTIVRIIENAITLVIGSKLELEFQALKDSLKERAIIREEAAQLQEALLTAFASRSAVEQLVKSQYDQELETISGGTGLPDIIAGVVKWSERQGRLDLLRKARAAKPEEPLLRVLAEQLGLTPTTGGPAVLSAPSSEIGKLHLTKAQSEQLNHALLSAFPNHAALGRMVRFGLNTNLDAVASGSRFTQIVSQLIVWCEEQGKIDQLVTAAREQAPGSAELREVAEQVGLAPTGPPTQDVEQIIGQGVQFRDVNAWGARLSIAAQAVCRVELARGALATGFLLGPSLAMTCYYVIEQLIGGQDDLTLRFDYQIAPDGITINQGTQYRLTDDWLVDHSPYDKLDYALLRVAGTPGNDPIGGQPGAPPRRWLVPNTTHRLKKGQPLFCLQHPKGGPLKVAFETKAVVGFNSDKTRVRYRVNTLGGSGGAPCFNSDLELVAIHEANDGKGNKLGIPIALVAAQPKVQAALGT